MSATVTLHCKLYVKHWLESQYGSVVCLPRKSNLLNLFLSCLSKKFYPSKEYDLKNYPGKVEFRVNQHDNEIFGTCISIQLQHHINDIFETEIKNYLHLFVYAHTRNGMTINKAIYLFQTQFGFTDEVFSFEAIRTAYYRREEEIKNIFLGTDTKTKQHAATIAQ